MMGFFDSAKCPLPAREVTKPTVSVHHQRTGRLSHHSYIGNGINTTFTDAFEIVRNLSGTVAVDTPLIVPYQDRRQQVCILHPHAGGIEELSNNVVQIVIRYADTALWRVITSVQIHANRL